MNYRLTIHPANSTDEYQPRLTWTVPTLLMNVNRQYSPHVFPPPLSPYVDVAVTGLTAIPAGATLKLYLYKSSESAYVVVADAAGGDYGNSLFVVFTLGTLTWRYSPGLPGTGPWAERAFYVELIDGDETMKSNVATFLVDTALY